MMVCKHQHCRTERRSLDNSTLGNEGSTEIIMWMKKDAIEAALRNYFWEFLLTRVVFHTTVVRYVDTLLVCMDNNFLMVSRSSLSVTGGRWASVILTWSLDCNLLQYSTSTAQTIRSTSLLHTGRALLELTKVSTAALGQAQKMICHVQYPRRFTNSPMHHAQTRTPLFSSWAGRLTLQLELHWYQRSLSLWWTAR